MASFFHPEAPIKREYGLLSYDEWSDIIALANMHEPSHNGSVTGANCPRCAYMLERARELIAERTQ